MHIRGVLDDTFASFDTSTLVIHLLDVVPTAQHDIVYFIDQAQHSEAIEEFTYLPVSAGSYSFIYTIAFTPTPTNTWHALAGTTLDIGVESDVSQAGVYTATLTGTLQGATGADTEDFTVTIVEIMGSMPNIEYRIGDANLPTTIPSFTTSPIAANPVTSTSYTFTFEVLESDKATTAPAWISVDGGNANVVIDQA